jgi:hypothetical protein
MQWWHTVITVAAVVAAVGVIWSKGILPMYRFAKKMEQHVEFVEMQMTSNGGSSLRDAIGRIEERVNIIEEHLTLPKR